MKRLLLPLTALLFVLLACGPSITPAPSPTHPLATSTLITTPPIPTPIATRLPAPTESVSTQIPSPTPAASSPASFSFSLEYGIPGVAKAYAVAGILNVKPQPIFGMWGLIEPQRGVYNWKPLDDLVVEYQSAGFSGIQLIITAESPWASIDPPALLHAGNTFPKQEFLDDYTAFVTRFVERYDGDGIEDAPGLRYPIHHYGLEREYTGFWPGSAVEYVRLLRLAYPAIHQADPQAQVVTAALLLVDVFDGSDARRSAAPPGSQPGFPQKRCRDQDFTGGLRSLRYRRFSQPGRLYRDPTNGCLDPGTAYHTRLPAKSLWIGDAFSMSALLGYNGRPFHTATTANRDQVLSSLQAITDPKNPAYQTHLSWVRAEIARGLVMKAVVSVGEWSDPNAPLLGINLGNLEDWMTHFPPTDAAAAPSFGTSMFMGMMDTTLTNQVTGPRLPNSSRAGQAHPAFYAYQLVADKIQWFTAVEKLELGKQVWAYRFMTKAGPVWVL